MIDNNAPQWIQIGGGGGEVCSIDTIGDITIVGTIAELEATQTDSWTQSNQSTGAGVLYVKLTRIAYDHTSDEILYGYYRSEAYNSCGKLVSISGETRVEIDPPAVCP